MIERKNVLNLGSSESLHAPSSSPRAITEVFAISLEVGLRFGAIAIAIVPCNSPQPSLHTPLFCNFKSQPFISIASGAILQVLHLISIL